ncbi:MAG TPA: MFS transporter [Microlunatus sp.]|nr:MFS transporter [Microlunatus sp.]
MTSTILTADRPALGSRDRPGAALFALAIGGFAIGTSEFATMGLLPQIAAGVDVDIPSAGHLISAYALGVVIGAPVIAAFAARLPRKQLLMALMAVFALGNLASALAATFGSLMLARFISGLPHGAYFGGRLGGGRGPGARQPTRPGRIAGDGRADGGQHRGSARCDLARPGARLARRSTWR